MHSIQDRSFFVSTVYKTSTGIPFFLKVGKNISGANTSIRPVYLASSTGVWSVVKSSTGIPIVCAFILTTISFVTRITGCPSFCIPLHT